MSIKDYGKEQAKQEITDTVNTIQSKLKKTIRRIEDVIIDLDDLDEETDNFLHKM